MKLNREAESIYRLQDYSGRGAIDGVQRIDLRRFNDDGGAMMELMRPGAGQPGFEGFELAQVNYSVLQPGVIKAFHVHRRQTDIWFVPPEDRILLVLSDVREASPSAGQCRRLMLGDGVPGMIRIPPGVAHGCRNLGTSAARIIYFTDVLFSADSADCDEGRLPWDHAGAEVWETSRE